MRPHGALEPSHAKVAACRCLILLVDDISGTERSVDEARSRQQRLVCM